MQAGLYCLLIWRDNLKDKISNKENNEAIEVSLLDGPDVETQVKEKPFKIAARIVAILVLFILLIASYVLKFSVDLYPDSVDKFYISSFKTESFYQTKSCDLIVVRPYENVKDAKVGDIIFYSSNIEKGSAKLVAFDNDILELEQNDGSIKRVSIYSVIGQHVKNIPVVGFIIAFLDSYYGIISLSLILIAYIAYLTFSRINFENTLHGKKLYTMLRKEQAEERARRKLLRQIKDIEGINLVVASILDGDYDENKKRFAEFNYGVKGDSKEKFKYILTAVHEGYLPKKTLNRTEKRQITAVLELMFESKSFDADIEYMLVDLALKIHLHDFCKREYTENAKRFVEECNDGHTLAFFGSVLYVLIYQNSRIRDEETKELALLYRQKMLSFDKTEDNEDLNV